ncbi:hypothetical protein [Pectobacterium atrosepticum]|uniref:hypothetical protein n=1 Tax=Pectobacterium atrosepticum TaxID=29471 RepID=UPI00049A41FA|nr:hypothetical protein [Pectobacterium atrosepticum]EAO9420731.1 hypothetical protein [Salmonella enterica]AIA71422.1 hypothetical protein EV46_12690 [Pectobacterium atrosepticum]EAS1812297.1 hypothetical protein [Salmonella enterica]EAX0900103.1 hypothetical protein [Salmonella enterica]EAY5449554.1 hypothetical protein [Salmonella enterica]
MSNHRFYIVKICTPEFLVYIPEFLKIELSHNNICPSNFIPIFVVIDRANKIDPIVCVTEAYALNKKKELQKAHQAEDPLFKFPILEKKLKLINEEEGCRLRIILLGEECEEELEELPEGKSTITIFDRILYSTCCFLLKIHKEINRNNSVILYLETSINYLKDKFDKIASDKDEISNSLNSLDKISNSNKPNI